MGLEVSDMMDLFARSDVDKARTLGVNAWIEGKNADANPYPIGNFYHIVWYRAWYDCNLYC